MVSSGKNTAVKKELKALAENIPFKIVEDDIIRKKSFKPVCVRQPREYVKMVGPYQAISRFLADRGKVEILSAEQNLHLFQEIHWCIHQVHKLSRKRFADIKKAREGLVQARRYISQIESAEEELFIANRRLVVNCVKPYFWIGQVWIADFLQEGSRALSNAIRKFDYTRGTPFYAYAQRSIQNRLLNFFRDHIRAGAIHVNPSREMLLIKQAEENWSQLHDNKPDDETIASITKLPLQQVRKIRPYMSQWKHFISTSVSLDAEMGDTDSNLYNYIEDEDVEEASKTAQKAEIRAAIERLPERSRFIMVSRYIKGYTLEETGQALGLTRARIKQIQDDALRQLRKMLHEQQTPREK